MEYAYPRRVTYRESRPVHIAGNETLEENNARRNREATALSIVVQGSRLYTATWFQQIIDPLLSAHRHLFRVLGRTHATLQKRIRNIANARP